MIKASINGLENYNSSLKEVKNIRKELFSYLIDCQMDFISSKYEVDYAYLVSKTFVSLFSLKRLLGGLINKDLIIIENMLEFIKVTKNRIDTFEKSGVTIEEHLSFNQIKEVISECEDVCNLFVKDPSSIIDLDCMAVISLPLIILFNEKNKFSNQDKNICALDKTKELLNSCLYEFNYIDQKIIDYLPIDKTIKFKSIKQEFLNFYEEQNACFAHCKLTAYNLNKINIKILQFIIIINPFL